MNVTNSGSLVEKFQQQKSSEMLSLTRSKDVLSEKMWVRAFLYAAIWSLENGPGFTSLLVQYHQHIDEPPSILQDCFYSADSHAHPVDSRSRLKITMVCSGNSENYANETSFDESKIRLPHARTRHQSEAIPQTITCGLRGSWGEKFKT